MIAVHAAAATVTFTGRRGPVAAVDGVDLEVGRGEFVSVLGPSGCGKSTLLRALAGLQPLTTGSSWCAWPAAFMPQQDCLLPWRRAVANAALGARVAGMPRAEATARARELMAEFGLAGFERAWPGELSGGMRQRLALLRTVLSGREILLLDEPFAALDPIRRRELNRWLAETWAGRGLTTVMVTHDVEEALLLSDRIVVLTGRPGRVRAQIVVDSLDRTCARAEVLACLDADQPATATSRS